MLRRKHDRKPKLTRIRNGVREVLCGGYVSHDTRQKNAHDYPVRRCREVRVWIRLDPDCPDFDDCGPVTNRLIRALENKLKRRFKQDRHVECHESWRY